MPEMLEIEIYRRAAAASLGRRIVAVDTSGEVVIARHER